MTKSTHLNETPKKSNQPSDPLKKSISLDDTPKKSNGTPPRKSYPSSEPKPTKSSLLRSESQSRLNDQASRFRSSIPLSRSSSLRSLRPASLSNLDKEKDPIKSLSKASPLRSASQTRLHDTKSASPVSRLKQSLRSESMTNLSSRDNMNRFDTSPPKSPLYRSGSQKRLNDSSPAQKLNRMRSGSQTRLNNSKPSSPVPKMNGLKSGSQTRLSDSKPSSSAPKMNGLKSESQARLHDSKPGSPAPKVNGLKSENQTKLNGSKTSSPAPKAHSKPVIKAKLGQAVSINSSKKAAVNSELKDISSTRKQSAVEDEISSKEKNGKGVNLTLK